MAIPDLIGLKYSKPKTAIIYAGAQLKGKRETQEDFYANFNDEFFIVADGVGGLPNGEVAAKLAVESALWGFKLIRQRPFYWGEKKKLIKRIFRSSNISVWQKQRETGFTEGMATTLTIAIYAEEKYWIGSAGDSCAFLYTHQDLKKITHDEVDSKGRLTNALGTKRFGMEPQFYVGPFNTGEVLVLATDGVTKNLSNEQIQKIVREAGETTESLTQASNELLKIAQKSGSTDNLTVYLVKKIALNN